jgi:MFS family permease
VSDRVFTFAFARVWLATFGAFVTFGMLVLTLPLYVKDELGRGSVGVGFAVGVASLTAIVASPVSGRLADRRGRRLPMIAGALVMTAGYVVLALGPGFVALSAARFVAGAGEAAFTIALYSVAIDLTREERHGEAMSLVTLASYLGLTVGPLAADLLLGDNRFGLVWTVAAAVTLTSLAVVATLPESRRELPEAVSSSWLPPHGALRPGLLVLIGLFGFGGFVAFAALYARDDLGVSRPGLVLALFGGVVACVRLFGRKLPDTLGARRTIFSSFIVLTVGLTIVGAWRSPIGLVIGTTIFAMGQALMYPSAVLLAMEATSVSERAAAVGSVGAFVDVALGLGALVLGGVASVVGYGGAFLVAAAVTLTGLAVLRPMRAAMTLPAEEAVP